MKNPTHITFIRLIILIVAISIVLTEVPETNLRKNKESPTRSFFISSSTFSSFSKHNGGKPERHVRSSTTEEYRDQDGDKPEQVRKYGEFFKKDNDNPAELKKRASTNVEEEELVLNTQPEEKISLKKEEEKKFFTDFDSHFSDFFITEKSAPTQFTSFGKDLFKEFDQEFNNFGLFAHGNYDKFLEKRKNNIKKKLNKI
jgi:hypothetical protein